MKDPRPSWPDLGALSALGFGPEAPLMNEPKLFVDRRLLSALLQQLDSELGRVGSATSLFQVGFAHGMRDARRVVLQHFLAAGSSPAGPPPVGPSLAMRLGGRKHSELPGALHVHGLWPEAHEADARLARLGRSEAPACALSAGYTSGWLSGVLDSDILVVETECLAHGDHTCRFEAREAEAWRRSADPRHRGLADAVDFGGFRHMAESSLDLPEPVAAGQAQEFGDFDRDAPVVHVWGPVMVLPFTTPEEALDTLDLLARESSADGVRAVVVDLRERILDDGDDAMALEHVIERVTSWDAEAILTGVAPVSRGIVHDAAPTHLVIEKDVAEAIAVAFQVAEVQRHVL